jgi:TolB-like protein/Tfp pilus assembly protein PilF
MLLALGDLVLDSARRELRHGVKVIALEPQVFDLLCYLVQHRDRVVSKDDLLQAVWGGRIVSDSTLAARLHAVRCALGDDGRAQRRVRTIRRAGVRFVGEVAETSPAGDAMSPVKAGLAGPAAADGLSIAVLPFANLSNEPELGHFAAGLVEELTTGLARLRWLPVVACAATLCDPSSNVDLGRTGAATRARYLLAGAVRRGGDRMRVTVRLVASETGRQLWARRFDRPPAGGFAVEDEITDAILAALELEVRTAEGERARRVPRQELGAWGLFQRGIWHLFRRKRDDFAAAHVVFGEALALDPAFARAHAGLAVWNFWQITHGITTDAGKSRAALLDAAITSVDLDPRDALAHSALGLALMEGREHANAVAQHELATTINPTSAFGQWCLGYALARADRNDEALPRFDHALQLDPRSPMAWSYSTMRASALYQLKRYEEAALAGEVAMQTPLADIVWPVVHRAAALGRLGRKREAEPVVSDLLRRRPGLTVAGFAAWPHNLTRSAATLEHTADGLQKAGLPL